MRAWGDYVPTGQEEDLHWMETRLKRKYEIKTEWFEPRSYHETTVEIFNLFVAWASEGIKYEADFRHAGFMINELNLDESGDVVTHGARRGQYQ